MALVMEYLYLAYLILIKLIFFNFPGKRTDDEKAAGMLSGDGKVLQADV